jgi:hypothetical protein
VVDCIQQRRGEAAGDGLWRRALWAMAMASFWGSLSQTKMMRMCARQRERERRRKGVAKRPEVTEIRS